MKSVSIIKDVLRNTPHAIAVDDGDKFAVKSLTEFGASLIDGVFSRNSYASKNLPAGFVATEFKQANDSVQRILDGINFEDSVVDVVAHKENQIQKKMHHTDRRSNKTSTNTFRSPSSRGLDKFKTPLEKINIVDFKARLFASASKNSEGLSAIKNDSHIGFNEKSSQLIARDVNGLASVAISRIVQHISQKEIVRARLSIKGLRVESPSRRANRRALFLTESEQVETDQSTNQRMIMALRSKLGRKI